jgi:hypothetical protein
MGLHGLEQGYLYFTFTLPEIEIQFGEAEGARKPGY